MYVCIHVCSCILSNIVPVVISFIRCSSSMVKPQPSQTFTPVYSEIVTTPSIEKSLSSKPLLMTSSLTESIVPVTSIQASTTSTVLPSSTLSPGEKEMKKLKQGNRFTLQMLLHNLLSKIGVLNTIVSTAYS